MRWLVLLQATVLLGAAQLAVAASPTSSIRPMPRGGVTVQPLIAPAPAQRAANLPGSRMAKLRPMPRPGIVSSVQPVTSVQVFYNAKIRPNPRPTTATASIPRTTRVVAARSSAALARSIRPEHRPENLRAGAVRQVAAVINQPNPVISRGKAGSICQDRSIRGEVLEPIPGKLNGCGVAAPVRVRSIDGVALSTPAIMDCTTAKALKTWLEKGVKPAVGRRGGGVASLKVAAHYSCRTRNNQKGAKISEHGRGRAIDISAITLANGVSLTVLKGWRDGAQSKMLKKMHKSACGPFGTVLGPNADRYHQDHFHLDTARYRNGAYCR